MLSSPRCAVVAYRRDHRYEQEFERVEPRSGGQRARTCASAGCTFVTGGLGGLGLTVASHSGRADARPHRPRGPLAHARSAREWDDWLTTDAATTIRRDAGSTRCAIEAAGAEVLLARADVTDALRRCASCWRRRSAAFRRPARRVPRRGSAARRSHPREDPAGCGGGLRCQGPWNPRARRLLADVDLTSWSCSPRLSALTAPAGPGRLRRRERLPRMPMPAAQRGRVGAESSR